MGTILRDAAVAEGSILVPGKGKPVVVTAPTASYTGLENLGLPSTLIAGVTNMLQAGGASELRAERATAALEGSLAEKIAMGNSPTESSDLQGRELESARAKAFDEGYAAGEAEGRQVWSEDVERLTSLIQQIDERWSTRVDEAEDLAVEIAFAAFTRLLGKHLLSREGVIETVKQVFSEAKENRAQLCIRLSPMDYEFVGEEGREKLATGRKAVTCVADARVKLGGCLLETEHGTLDGRLEIQLERLKEALLDARRNPAA